MNCRVKRWGVAIAVSCCLGACAPTPTLRSVLLNHYPGYDQISPSSSVISDDGRYEYLPGNIIALERVEERTQNAAAAWNVNSSIYCPTNIPLSALKAARRGDAHVVHDFDLSLRKVLRLKKAKADLNLEDNEVEVLRQVEIDVLSVRRYKLGRKQNPKFDVECLSAVAGRRDLNKLRSVLVGDVHVKILFKNNVSLFAKLAVANKIQSNLGFGYLQGFSQDYRAENMVFAARIAPTKIGVRDRR